jgi:hypothetical protein
MFQINVRILFILPLSWTRFSEREVKSLLQDTLVEQYRTLIRKHEDRNPGSETPAMVDFSLLVIFCVEVLWTPGIMDTW